MHTYPWFEVEDPEEEGDEPWDFDADELAFIAALQDRAARWRVPWASSWVGRPEDDASLLVHISLCDGERRTIVGEWAVHFHGSYVRAGRVSDQLYNVSESRGGVLSRTTGTPEELAARCAEWFEAVLSRPVARLEWVNEGRVYGTRWLFADTGEGLVTDTNADGAGHARCVLVRGAASPSTGSHTALCPFEPARATTAGVGPSRIPSWVWRGGDGPGRR
ncbi:hypothetical protein [Streptomyces venezuelae]|uniref:hypothetical protein n=1 Tax=Streptomyces venezuelae TaxID=54571 RepID=UPI0037B86327